ncbi:hypothetical protein FKM82_025089 [Ascaphus truei]
MTISITNNSPINCTLYMHNPPQSLFSQPPSLTSQTLLAMSHQTVLNLIYSLIYPKLYSTSYTPSLSTPLTFPHHPHSRLNLHQPPILPLVCQIHQQ